MSLKKQYATDKSKEENGAEFKLFEAANDDGTIPTFYIARMGASNKAWAKAMEAAMRPFRRQIELKTMDPEKAKEIQLEVFCEHILKGWKNVRASELSDNDQGEAFLEVNKQNAIALMKKYPDLHSDLENFSVEIANYRIAGLEEDAKN